MRIHAERSLALTVAFIQLAWSSDAAAQSDAVRRRIDEEVRAVAPCPAAPSSNLTLDEQLTGWEDLEACVAAAGVARRAAPVDPDDTKAQVEALRLAAMEERALASIGASEQRVANQKDFLELSWGVGFGFGWAEDDRIEQAQIVNGVVQATKDTSEQARLFFEYHWFPESWQPESFKRNNEYVRGHGPYVAVSSRDDKVVSGVGVGWMFGFRDKGKAEGFTIAFGAMLDNDVISLADGFEDGQPPPNGETVVRTETKSRVAYTIFFTRSF